MLPIFTNYSLKEYTKQNIAKFGVALIKCIPIPVQNIYTAHSNYGG
jgi:hypothetical protein